MAWHGIMRRRRIGWMAAIGMHRRRHSLVMGWRIGNSLGHHERTRRHVSRRRRMTNGSSIILWYIGRRMVWRRASSAGAGWSSVEVMMMLVIVMIGRWRNSHGHAGRRRTWHGHVMASTMQLRRIVLILSLDLRVLSAGSVARRKARHTSILPGEFQK